MKKPLVSTKAKAELMAFVIGDHFLEIARWLRQTHEKSPELFPGIADQIGLSLRGAHALARISQVFDELRVSRQRLENIGWAKLQVIASKIDAQNCKQMLTLAEEKSVHDLVKILHGDVPHPGSQAVVLLLTLEQLAVFETVLLKHGAIKAAGGKLVGREAALIAAFEAYQ